jgi:hypothetical protein
LQSQCCPLHITHNTLSSTTLYEKAFGEKQIERSKNNKKDAFKRTYRSCCCALACSRWPTLPPPSRGGCPCTSTTTAVFGCTTSESARAAPIPFPRPAIKGVVRAGRVPSTVGIVPIGLHWSMTLHQSGEEEGGEDEDDEHQISVVTGPVGALVICRMTRISIGPRGRPQGPLALRTATTPPNSL